MVKKLLIQLLRKIADDLDTGNSNLTDTDANEALCYVNKMLHKKDMLYTRIEAARYLGISETKFNYIRKNNLISNGKKKAGDVRKWSKEELDEYIEKNKP